MYIRRVKIKNVRGFREVDLDFSRPDGSLAGWTVLAGRNGSGKSTLLKTLGLVPAGPEAARVLNTSFSDWIRGEEQQAEAGVQLEFSDADRFAHLDLLTGWARLQWDRAAEEREPRLSGKLPETAQTLTKKGQRRQTLYSLIVMKTPMNLKLLRLIWRSMVSSLGLSRGIYGRGNGGEILSKRWRTKPLHWL